VKRELGVILGAESRTFHSSQIVEPSYGSALVWSAPGCAGLRRPATEVMRRNAVLRRIREWGRLDTDQWRFRCPKQFVSIPTAQLMF
jgi:hypothetical protein